MRRYLGLTLASLLLIAAGCKRATPARTDAQIASDVQNKINADNNLPDKQLTINANNGVVTLTGNVSTDAARTTAASDAAQVEGVKTVVNNLEVAPATTASNTEQPAPQPEAATPEPPRHEANRSTLKHSSPKHHASNSSNDNDADNGLRTTVPPNGASTDLSNNNNQSASMTPAAPPAPTPVPKVTIPAGTQLSIRINQELNS